MSAVEFCRGTEGGGRLKEEKLINYLHVERACIGVVAQRMDIMAHGERVCRMCPVQGS